MTFLIWQGASLGSDCCFKAYVKMFFVFEINFCTCAVFQFWTYSFWLGQTLSFTQLLYCVLINAEISTLKLSKFINIYSKYVNKFYILCINRSINCGYPIGFKLNPPTIPVRIKGLFLWFWFSLNSKLLFFFEKEGGREVRRLPARFIGVSGYATKLHWLGWLNMVVDAMLRLFHTVDSTQFNCSLKCVMLPHY